MRLGALCCTDYDIGALQVVLDFEFLQLMPARGDITIEHSAKNADLDPNRTGLLVRQLMAYGIFEKLRPRVSSHSSTAPLFQYMKNYDLLFTVRLTRC